MATSCSWAICGVDGVATVAAVVATVAAVVAAGVAVVAAGTAVVVKRGSGGSAAVTDVAALVSTLVEQLKSQT